MDTVYIETSIVSHATAWPSSDIQIAAVQHQAREWWAIQRPKFNLVTSQLTVTEASDGDQSAAADRLKLLDGIPLVALNAEVDNLANLILANHIMPQKAAADSVHAEVDPNIRTSFVTCQGGSVDRFNRVLWTSQGVR